MSETLRNTALFALAAGLIVLTGMFQSWNTALQIVNMGLVSALMAGLTLLNTFRPDVDASLWPSPFLRYAGAAINALGVFGFIAALVGYLRWRAA